MDRFARRSGAFGGLRRVASTAAVSALLLVVLGCGGADSSGGGGRPVTPTASAGLRVVSARSLSDRMRDLVIHSPAVGRDVNVRLLLPADFANATRPLPVLYLLPGCCDTYDSWTRSTDLVAWSARTEALIVMPEAGAAGFYSNWRKGPQWEDFHLTELPQILRRDFRASTTRAIAGLSMGGLGALDYAARHPGTFTAAASFSGVVHTRRDADIQRGYQDLVRSQGEDPGDLWGDPVADAATWRAHNPYDLAARLRGTKLYLACGDGKPGTGDDPGQAARTELALRAENAALARKLRRLDIPATVHLYGPGVHDWKYWQRELHRSWPLLTRSLGV